jgi:hypothetical protein
MTSLNTQIADHLKKVAGEWPEEPATAEINGALRVACRWRQILILQQYRHRHGTMIWGGPFKGMDYVAAATEGALLPRLLGSYEGELHPHLQAFAEQDLEVIIDVGCAEGYSCPRSRSTRATSTSMPWRPAGRWRTRTASASA